MKSKMGLVLLVGLVMSGLIGLCQGDGKLKKNFYRKTCPDAEDIIRKITWKNVATNPVLPAKFLRMHFHDCFVRGCDGSILLNSTASFTAEKDSIPNAFLSGFDVIDDIKASLERVCPGVVSCADILALAARDSISYQFRRPIWKVRTGRRDGTISLSSEVFANIPSPFSNFTQLQQNFRSKGLSVRDLVVLSGGHTIGVGHCNLFSNRLYNFTGRGDQDPSLNPQYARFLRTVCRNQNDNTTTVSMDPGSEFKFDTNYYVILNQNKGMFQSDAALLTNNGARKVALEMINQKRFFKRFEVSMRKMGDIEILTGNSGEIRRHCAFVN